MDLVIIGGFWRSGKSQSRKDATMLGGFRDEKKNPAIVIDIIAADLPKPKYSLNKFSLS